MKITRKLKKITLATLSLALVAVSTFGMMGRALATSFSISPMNQTVVLNPGETYRSTFIINNPSTNKDDFSYRVVVQPYTVGENNSDVFNEASQHTLITDWIKIIAHETGTLAPNSTDEVEFEVDVPYNAPAGGQYASLTVVSENDASSDQEGFGISETIAIAHLFYAEITGETIRQGDILEANVNSFLLSGNITGTSAIRNTGNVHSRAKYTLQVFPLFSDEELYTNEENPETALVLPDKTYYNETSWKNTPMMGIFKVIYNVEYEGMKAEVSKMVIVCPIWMLFIVIFVIAAIIIWLVSKAIRRDKR